MSDNFISNVGSPAPFIGNVGGVDPNSLEPEAMQLLQSVTPSGTGVVTFNNIPGTFQDLMVVIRGASTAAAGNVTANITLNNDTGNNYQDQYIQASGNAGNTNNAGAVAAASIATGILPAASATNPGGYVRATIFGYVSATFNKAVEILSGMSIGSTTSGVFLKPSFGIWLSNVAVNRVDVTLSSGNFVAGSVVSLYGIQG